MSTFVCPQCRAPLDASRPCTACGFQCAVGESIHDFLLERRRSEAEHAVEEFYTRRPFPGYAPLDDANTLIDRSRASPFLRALDASIAANARVIDCGAGTGQLAAFLAIAAPHRSVIAVDATRASLAEAARFKERTRIDNLVLVRADLFALPFADGAFDVVISRGVVHHTPEPLRAVERVATLVRPGGHLVLGFYENLARGVHRTRRVLARARGRPIELLDPLLRRADIDPEKKLNWIEDQYRHPLEHVLAFPRILRAVEALGFEWVRSVPPAPESADLFAPTERPSSARLFARRGGWFFAGFRDEDAGLVALVARRQLRA